VRGRSRVRDKDEEAHHIAGLLDSALREMGVRREVREVQLKEAFAAVIGPALAPLCDAISLERGTLLVATRNGALAQQLQLEMPVITAELNRRLGDGQVRRLRFTALS
jgi:predicted nucleic acid-binding Zn ribbon protein